MQNSELHDFHDGGPRTGQILDMVSAHYDLQIQKHRELIAQLKQPHANERQDITETSTAPDFIIHPRRAA